jgi:hypothetical protein
MHENAVMSDPLVRAADRYAEQMHPAPRRRREHAVSKLVAAYIACPEVVAAAALHEAPRHCGFGELRSRFGESTARLVAEVSHARIFGRASQQARVALETKRLQRLSPEAQSIRVATLIQRTQRLLNQPPTLARVGLSQTCAELAALEGAHPVLHSIARKLCGAAFRRLAGAAQGV